MTNVDPKVAQKLAAAVAHTTKPPKPPGWVQGLQMAFASFCLLGGVAVALVLILHGPPAPKEAEATGGANSQAAKAGAAGTALHRQPAPLSVYVAAGDEETTPAGGEGRADTTPSGEGGEPSPGSGSESGECDSSGESECGESEPSDSLANLNEQAPWAFAIIALLVGAFLATGKTLNVLGAKKAE
jgi:hypothetical protein